MSPKLAAVGPAALNLARVLVAIRRDRSEIRRGDYLTTDQLQKALEPPRRRAGRKKRS